MPKADASPGVPGLRTGESAIAPLLEPQALYRQLVHPGGGRVDPDLSIESTRSTGEGIWHASRGLTFAGSRWKYWSVRNPAFFSRASVSRTAGKARL